MLILKEVERIILTFPVIIEIFVFSVVNEKWGEAVSNSSNRRRD